MFLISCHPDDIFICTRALDYTQCNRLKEGQAMKTQGLSEKMKKAYQNMVETIETLIDREGKQLKEAVLIAEEKLSSLQELSKEEAQKISTEIKSDLQSIGETINGAKLAYKEQFKIEANYLTEALWEKLSKVADVGTEEFLAFSEDLKQRARKARLDDHASEHKDHLHWSSDHEFWLDEVELWKKDHQDALQKLQAIETAIKKHTDYLEEHAQAIRAHEELDHEHEETILANELDPTSRIAEENDEKDISVHKQEKQLHATHAKLHQNLKKNHRKMMAMINHLYKQVVDE